MRNFLVTIGCLALIPVLAGSASAQFQMMDRQGSQTKLDAHVGFVVPDAPGYFVRTDLYGQVNFFSFGVYAALPVTKPVDFATSDAAAGNLEIGGIYTWDIIPTLDLVSHIGVAVPTAGSSATDFAVNLAGNFTRINDLVPAAIPDLTTLRLATSPVFELGPVFFRADLGVDFAFPSAGSTSYFFRANVGAGVNIMIVTLTGEFANVGWLDAPGGVEFLHTASVGAVLNTPIIQPYMGFTTPLDEGLVGNVFEVSAGLKLQF